MQAVGRFFPRLPAIRVASGNRVNAVFGQRYLRRPMTVAADGCAADHRGVAIDGVEQQYGCAYRRFTARNRSRNGLGCNVGGLVSGRDRYDRRLGIQCDRYWRARGAVTVRIGI